MIKYKDLSLFLKFAAIGGIINIILFAYGFIIGFVGAI